MTPDLQELRRAARRAWSAAGHRTGGWKHTATMFARTREQLIEAYRCSVCNGRRLEGVAGIFGPYYRVCRGCGGRGYRAQPNEEE